MSRHHLTFDGAGYITLPADAPKFENDKFSIEFMAQTPEDGSGGGVVFDSYDPDGGPYGFGCGIHLSIDGSGRPTAIIKGGLRYGDLPVIATGSFVAGTWYHYCLTLTATGQARWYINAQEKETVDIWGGSYDPSEANKYIGANWTGFGLDDYFKGNIYNFGYYADKALTESDVQSRYQAVDFAGTEDGLSWASNMNTGSGTTVYDVLGNADAIISGLDHVTWEISDIPFVTPYPMGMRIVPCMGNLRSILIPPFGGLGGLVPGFRVYRGADGIVDYADIIATMAEDDAQVVINGQDLPPDTIWHYVRRKVQPCGLESPDSPPCIIIIDANGDMIGDAPNTPESIWIEQLAGGKLRVRWRYSQIGQDVEPTGFNIYMDSGSGFDFDTPAATIAYRPWSAGGLSSGGYGGLNDNVQIIQGLNGEFSWTSGELVDGQLYRFCVRAYRSGEGETQNTNYASARADATGPDAAANLIASWQEVPD